MANSTSTQVSLPSDLSVDAVQKFLVDDKSRASLIAKFDADIEARKAELAKLEEARKIFGMDSSSVPSPSAPSKRGRKPGPGAEHGPAILASLKGKKNGLLLRELHEAVVAAGHEMERKTVATYLNHMIKRGQVIQEGERGNYKYRVTAPSAKA